MMLLDWHADNCIIIMTVVSHRHCSVQDDATCVDFAVTSWLRQFQRDTPTPGGDRFYC